MASGAGRSAVVLAVLDSIMGARRHPSRHVTAAAAGRQARSPNCGSIPEGKGGSICCVCCACCACGDPVVSTDCCAPSPPCPLCCAALGMNSEAGSGMGGGGGKGAAAAAMACWKQRVSADVAAARLSGAASLSAARPAFAAAAAAARAARPPTGVSPPGAVAPAPTPVGTAPALLRGEPLSRREVSASATSATSLAPRSRSASSSSSLTCLSSSLRCSWRAVLAPPGCPAAGVRPSPAAAKATAAAAGIKGRPTGAELPGKAPGGPSCCCCCCIGAGGAALPCISCLLVTPPLPLPPWPFPLVVAPAVQVRSGQCARAEAAA